MTSHRLIVSLPNSEVRSWLGEAPEDVDFIEWDLSEPPPLDVIDIVVPPYMGGTTRLAALSKVRTQLVQSLSIGYDGVAAVLPPGNVYANAASVHEASTAELALALVLSAQRAIPDFVRAAEKGHWAPQVRPSLADREVLLIGYGGVGRAIEERLIAFEVSITRVAGHEREDERGTIHGVASLPELLARADIVIVAVPLTPGTTRLVDDDFLNSMRDGALLVNVARGRVADTDAMVRHASSGRVRLALDVVDPEPLPDGHPLFALENVLISPHVGGATSAMQPRAKRLLLEQIGRVRRGETPLNVVLRS
ncbi:MAG: 2-hydroxyacid dehydrogenase [Acidobacteria bacterium]|nr:2-hydroxyacid dehydrogenase [Acidobacteriota bacterium]